MGYKKRVLILEDDPFYTTVLLDHFNQFDVDYSHYSTISEFIKADHKVDLIFLDYYLEHNRTSDEIIDFLISNGCQAKIVILSSQQDGNKVLQLIQKGIRDYIMKGESTFDEIRSVMNESGIRQKPNSLSA